MRWVRSARVLAAVFASALFASAVLVLAGCAPSLDAKGTPLTIEQSESLAAARFELFTRGPFRTQISLGADSDVDHLSARLSVDPDVHHAWGTVSRGPKGIAVTEDVILGTGGALTTHGGSWVPSDLPPATVTALQAVFTLATDRPENAQLLRQGDARYLGKSVVNGADAAVYRLPSSDGAASQSRIWLGDSGVLERVDSGDDAGLVIDVHAHAEPEPAGADAMWNILDAK